MKHSEKCKDNKLFGERCKVRAACDCYCHCARWCIICSPSHWWDLWTGKESEWPTAAAPPRSAGTLPCPSSINRSIEAAAVTGWLQEIERTRLSGVEMIEKCWGLVGGAVAAMQYSWSITYSHPTLKGAIPRCDGVGEDEP